MPPGRRKKKNGRGDSGKAADVESVVGNEPIPSNESPAFSARVGITVDSFRARSCDPDGVSGKAAIDGLVHCGVLRGDTSKEIAWVHYNAPTKVQNESEEKTVITIEEV